MDCAKTILRTDGVRGFYKGLMPSLIGVVPYAGIDLCIYEVRNLGATLVELFDGLNVADNLYFTELSIIKNYPESKVQPRVDLS